MSQKFNTMHLPKSCTDQLINKHRRQDKRKFGEFDYLHFESLMFN